MSSTKNTNTRLSGLILGTALLSASPVMGGTSTSMGCGAGRCGAGKCGSQMQPSEEDNATETKTPQAGCGANSCGAVMKPDSDSGE